LDPSTSGFHAVISGHSHQPKIATVDGVLYFNPGSAGPRRFTLPISVGRLIVSDQDLVAEIIELQV
jgi:predicted phosphodiesterase